MAVFARLGYKQSGAWGALGQQAAARSGLSVFELKAGIESPKWGIVQADLKTQN